jgi:hypothetical protein
MQISTDFSIMFWRGVMQNFWNNKILLQINLQYALRIKKI